MKGYFRRLNIFRKQLNAYTIYLMMQGLSSFFYSTVWTLATIYRTQVAGLNPFQLILVGTCLEIFAFLFEIPTGVVADLYSRKLSMIIGFFVIGIGFIVEGTLPYFAAILLAQALWGIGYTFTSGADAAWIADEVGEEKVTAVFLRGSQVSQIGALVGIGVSVLLANIGLGLPIVFGGAAFVALSVFLALTMPETGFQPTPKKDRNSWQAMADTFKAGIQSVRQQPALLILLGVGLFYGLFSEGIDRLWEVHVLSFQLPTAPALSTATWFGLISGVTSVMSILASQLLTKKANLHHSSVIGGLLVAINSALILSVAAFALAGNFSAAVGCYLATSLLRRTNGPLRSAWVNRSIPSSEVRATILSMAAQLDALGQVIGGPIIGLIAVRGNVSLAILAAGVTLLPIPALYAVAARQKGGALTHPPIGSL